MKSYEQLMHEALEGNKETFNVLESCAGSGSAEAQYYLALYYAKKNGGEQNENYQYWMKKAKDNGYDAAQAITITEQTDDNTETKSETDSNNSLKALLMKFSFMGRINRTEYIISIIIAVALIFIVANVEDPIARRIMNIVIDVFWWSQCARRLHDFGASGWYVLIPVVSWIYAAFPKGDKDENEYGIAPDADRIQELPEKTED